MSEQNSTLSSIFRIANWAIEKQRERRRETGVSGDDRSVQVLLLYLATIKSLARNALPETEQALLPQEANLEQVRRQARKILEVADEFRARRIVLH
jgi:hypothetical protein